MVKERNAQDHLAQSCQQQRIDVNKQLQFLEKVISTSYKPATKQVLLMELTMPWETRMEDAHVRRLAK